VIGDRVRIGRPAQGVRVLACAGAVLLALARAAPAQPPAAADSVPEPATEAPGAPAEMASPSIPGLPSPPAPAPPGWEPRGAAELQALDKIDDRSASLNVPVGQTVQFEHLLISVRACLVRPADQAPDAAGFLQIVDKHPGTPGFSGWMLAAEPYVSMLQHPAFDVRVLGCR